ncbi:MAG: hypothetical protein ABIP03_11435 [Aquihabitans sp.]
MDGDGAESSPKRVGPRRRDRLVMVAALVIVVVVGMAAAGLLLFNAHLTFPYDGPSEAVRPGATVEIRAPGEACGPLIVSLSRPSILGQWNQTHSGNAVGDSFTADKKSWWSLSSGTYITRVPCAADGTIRFTLPTDVTGSVVAACDSDRRCAKVHVDQAGGE